MARRWVCARPYLRSGTLLAGGTPFSGVPSAPMSIGGTVLVTTPKPDLDFSSIDGEMTLRIITKPATVLRRWVATCTTSVVRPFTTFC